MINRWKITGQAKFDDEPSPLDVEINREIEVDSLLTKVDIEYALQKHYADYRYVWVIAEIIDDHKNFI